MQGKVSYRDAKKFVWDTNKVSYGKLRIGRNICGFTYSYNQRDTICCKQGAVDTLVENAKNEDFSFSATKTTCVNICQGPANLDLLPQYEKHATPLAHSSLTPPSRP